MRKKKDLKRPRNVSLTPDEWAAARLLGDLTGKSRSGFIGFILRITLLKYASIEGFDTKGLFKEYRMADFSTEDVLDAANAESRARGEGA